MAQSTFGPVKGTTGGDTYLYEFQICGQGFNCGLVAGAGAKGGACQSWGDFMSRDTEACLGVNTPSSIFGMNDGLGVTLQYLNGDSYKFNPRSTNVVLKCDKSQKGWGKVTFDDSKQLDLLWTITIASEHACPGENCLGEWSTGKKCSCATNNASYECLVTAPSFQQDTSISVTSMFNANQICVAADFLKGDPIVSCGFTASKICVPSNKWKDVIDITVFCISGNCVQDAEQQVLYNLQATNSTCSP